MAFTWTLRELVATKFGIDKPADLHRLLTERTNLKITVQAVGLLLSKPPEALRIPTMQALCTALNCKLSDFASITSDKPLGDAQAVIISASISAEPKKAGTPQLSSVFVTYSKTDSEVILSFEPDKFSLKEEDFIGLTRQEALMMFHHRYLDYLKLAAQEDAHA